MNDKNDESHFFVNSIKIHLNKILLFNLLFVILKMRVGGDIMKKLYGIVIMALVLCVSGCGGSSDELRCTVTDSGLSIELVVSYDGDTLKGADIITDYGDTTLANTAYEYYQTSGETVKISGSKITQNYTAGELKAELRMEGTIEEMKASLEDEGFTCE